MLWDPLAKLDYALLVDKSKFLKFNFNPFTVSITLWKR